jgi:hypothetical protein
MASEGTRAANLPQFQSFQVLNLGAMEDSEIVAAVGRLEKERAQRAPKEETGPISGTSCDITGFFSDFSCLDRD